MTSEPPPFCLSPSSSLDKEAGAPSRLLVQPEKEPIACPPSQVSLFWSFSYVLKEAACLLLEFLPLFILTANRGLVCPGDGGQRPCLRLEKETSLGVCLVSFRDLIPPLYILLLCSCCILFTELSWEVCPPVCKTQESIDETSSYKGRGPQEWGL